MNNIIKNTSMLYIMNIAKMVFPLVTLPYLTRVLTVECYGVVSYVKALMQYMQLIIDFGFMLSGTKDIVLARDDKDKLNYEVGNILLAKLILSLFALAVLLVAIFYIQILNENTSFVLLSFVTVFLTNFLFDYLFRGLEKMEVITIRFVVMKGIAAVLTFLFVKNDADILWIPVLDILGSIFGIVLIVLEIRKLSIVVRVGQISEVLKKIQNSAIYFLSTMATTAFMALNTLLIGIVLTTTEVAYWSLCLQMVTAVQALYTPLINGIYPHMLKTKDINLLKKIIKFYMPFITLGCLFTLIIANYALVIIGGSQYAEASNVLRALVPVMFFSFFSMLFGWPVLGAINKEREVMITTIATAIVQVVGLLILFINKHFNLVSIALLRGGTEALLFGLRFRYVTKFKDKFL